MGRHETLVVTDHQFLAGLLRGSDHLLGVRQAGGHGLLAEDMLAGLEGSDGQAGMVCVGSGHHDGVDVLPGEQGFLAGNDLAAVLTGKPFGTRHDGVVDRHDLGTGMR